MKKLVTTYTFDASAQTIVSASFTSLDNIQLITNVTDNIIIYNFADPTKGGSLVGTTLTLAYNTTSMSDTDNLQIFYEDPSLDLPINEVGRVKTSNLPADITPVTGTITANGQTIPVPTSRVSNVMAHCYGTFSTVNCTFEGSLNSTNGTDGNWFTIQAVRTSANTIETTTGNLSAAPAYAWEMSVNALSYIRVRATAFTSGTQSWVFTLGSYATEPIPAAQVSSTQPVSIAAAAASIGKAEDAAHANGDVGVPALAVRSDTAASLAGATNDYQPLITDASGRVWTDPQGNVAHDAADAGNPIKVGGRASTTPVTAVAANDRVDAFFDVQGRQIVSQKALTATSSNVNASASSVTVLAANTARLGATFYNDSTAIGYLKLGATASTTSFTVKMQPDAYYEIPYGYYGIVDCIWASATGVMRVVEVS